MLATYRILRVNAYEQREYGTKTRDLLLSTKKILTVAGVRISYNGFKTGESYSEWVSLKSKNHYVPLQSKAGNTGKIGLVRVRILKKYRDSVMIEIAHPKNREIEVS